MAQFETVDGNLSGANRIEVGGVSPFQAGLEAKNRQEDRRAARSDADIHCGPMTKAEMAAYHQECRQSAADYEYIDRWRHMEDAGRKTLEPGEDGLC